MPTTAQILAPFHTRIVVWRRHGLSLNEIVAELAQRGVQIHRSALDRYCQAARIPLGSPDDNMAEQRTSSPTPDPDPDGVFYEPPPPRRLPPGPTASPARLEPQPRIETPPMLVSTPALLPTTTPAPNPTPTPTPTPTPNPPPARTVVVTPPPAPRRMIAGDFPEFDRERRLIVALATSGATLAAIAASLRGALGMSVDEGRLGLYVEAMLDEEYPPGKVRPDLLEIPEPKDRWRGDRALFAIDGEEGRDEWTIDSFAEGTGIFGATGSGKTSCSGRAIGAAMLHAGYGALILTAKEDECAAWTKLAFQCGRGPDLVLLQPGGVVTIDAINYELAAAAASDPSLAGVTENMLRLIKNLAGVLVAKIGGGPSAMFWQQTNDQLFRMLNDLLIAAGEKVTIETLAGLVHHAPSTSAEAEEERWRRLPVFGPLMEAAEKRATTPDRHRMLTRLREYWLVQYPRLAPETRGCITIGFTAMIDALRSPGVHQAIAQRTTFTPEMIFAGKVAIVNWPLAVHHEAGLLVQTIIKYIVQRAALRRKDQPRRDRCRPCVIFEDEGHSFVIDHDAEFAPVARDRRVARVLITQNINNLYQRFGGGPEAHAKVQAVLGCLNTRIFHTNGDMATNQWASELLGTHDVQVSDTSTTPPSYHGFDPLKDLMTRWFKKPVTTTSKRTVREPWAQPSDFAMLQPPSAGNGWVSEAAVTQVGRRFASGLHFRKACFPIVPLEELNFGDDELIDEIQNYRRPGPAN